MSEDSASSASATGRVGPIVFSNPVARRQLVEEGEVVTFRGSERTRGATHWRKKRTGKKQGDCVVMLEDRVVLDETTLAPYQEESGFDSVGDWMDAINDLHGANRGSEGNLYRVRRVSTDGGTSESGTKYSIPDDYEWDDQKQEQPEPGEDLPARLDDHTVKVHHKTDPDRPNGYRYEFAILHGEEWCPVALPMKKEKWAGNFWREHSKLDDRDWPDIPYCVKTQVLGVVAGVDSVEDLAPEVDDER